MEVSEGLEDKVSCPACDFVGTRKDLYLHPYVSDHPIQDGELLQRMSDDLARRFMAVAAVPLAQWLSAWGFLWWEGTPRDVRDQAFRVQVMAQYARAAGMGMVRAILDTRRTLEKERVHHEQHYTAGS